MLSKEASLSIVLPVHNEETNIKNIVSSVISYVCKYIDNFEVIVVNDGSTDASLKILNGIKVSCPELKIISQDINKGYGCTIKRGINFSQKEWIFIMDPDGQFQIDDFEIFWKNKKSYDFILGYRMCRRDNLYRILLGKLGNLVANLLLQKRIEDINCGFKLFRKRDLGKLQLRSNGGIICFEILYNLFKNNKNKFLQLPVRHYKRKRGKASGGNLKVILKIIWEGTKIVCRR